MYVALRVIASPDEKYVFVLDMYYGIFVVDVTPIYTATKYPVTLSIVSQFAISGVMFGQEISKDGNYLFVSCRSNGVYIFDISNRSQIRMIQFLK